MLYLDLLPNSIRRIQEMDVRVCVIGVGTIGLPLATFLAKVGFQVTGLDIDQKRVDEINSAKVVYEYTNILDDVVLKSKKLHATTEPKEALDQAEIIFVCVPTPLNTKKEMDKTLNALEKSLFIYKKALDSNPKRFIKGPVVKPVFRKFN